MKIKLKKYIKSKEHLLKYITKYLSPGLMVEVFNKQYILKINMKIDINKKNNNNNYNSTPKKHLSFFSMKIKLQMLKIKLKKCSNFI